MFRYLRGGTLEGRLTSGAGLSVRQCRTLVSEVGSALAAAHRAGVVHRDVKPANVFCDEEGHFYLGDFGIALETAELDDPARDFGRLTCLRVARTIEARTDRGDR